MAHGCEDLSKWTTVAQDGRDYVVDSNPATSATSDAPAQDNCDRVVNEPPGDLQADHAVPEFHQEDAKADDVVNESPSNDAVDHATQEPAHEVHEDPHAVDNQSAVSDASWERVECAAGDNAHVDQRSFPRPSKNLVAVFMGVLSVGMAGMAGMAATAHSMCGSIDPTMQGAKVEIMKKLVPFGTSRCFEGALDSCILQFNGTVIDSSAKQGYLETWQNQGFPPINCHDLGSEIWVSGFPQNCEGAWSNFGPCSASCGGGTRSSAFQITRQAQNGGAPCHEKNQLKTEKCNDQPCPVDCVLFDWQPDVSGCSKLCGNGTVKETREVQHDASHGGDCPDPTSDQRERWVPCNVDPCPVDLLEGLQSTLVATAQTVQNIQEALAARGTLELRNRLQFNCAGGISEDLAEAAAACVENNVLATKTKEMSLVLEQVQDDCGMIWSFFGELVNSLKLDLPASFKDACTGSAEHEELTLSFLDKHINRLLNQIEVCRTHSKTLKAKNEDLISSRSGYGQDAERRSRKLLAELKNLELEEPSLKSELLSRAGVMEETKQILETKKEDLKRSGRQLEDLKQQQLHGLSVDKAADDDATSKDGEARQHAENLESSLKGKQRSGNLGLQAAQREAKDLEDQAQQKMADYIAKLKEYNQAAANLESTVKAGEEAVRKHMQSIAENQKMSDEVRSRQVQVDKMILGKYLEIRNLNRFQQMSEVSNQAQLDSRLEDARQTLQGLSMKFKFVRDYLESLKQEGRMKTGPGACDEARNVALNIFHSVREVVRLG